MTTTATTATRTTSSTPLSVPSDPDQGLAQALAGLDIELREYQQRIVRKAIHMFAGKAVPDAKPNAANGHLEATEGKPAASVLIESPTGSGKTVMGLIVARWLQEVCGLRVGWVAMRRNLLVQAEQENRRRGFDVDMAYVSMFDKHPPDVDVLIVDEAQHDAAASMADLHAKVAPKMILGLSATPYRTDRMKLCFEKVIRDAGIGQLIQAGYLSRYRHFTIAEWSPELVAETYLREPVRWGKSLFFFHKMTECRRFDELMAEAGVECEVVTAASNRYKQIDAFVAGEVDVLVNMAILTEGFDCPTLATVFCRPSGKSCTIQMAGRVLRQHPDFDLKQIVQCKQTRHPMLKTAPAAEQYVRGEDGWQSLTLNPMIEQIGRRMLQVIADTPTELPKFLTRRQAHSIEHVFHAGRTEAVWDGESAA